jgi:hypothetical protein
MSASQRLTELKAKIIKSGAIVGTDEYSNLLDETHNIIDKMELVGDYSL